jgi:hypothetical protein
MNESECWGESGKLHPPLWVCAAISVVAVDRTDASCETVKPWICENTDNASMYEESHL